MLFVFWISSVYADGSICLDILQNQWSPIYDVAAILTSIQVIVLPFYLFFFLSLYIYWKLMALVLMGAVKIGCRQSHMQQLLVTYALDSHGWSIIRSVKESFISLLDNCYLLFFMNFSFCFNMVRESLILKSKTIKTFSLQQSSGPPFLFF